MNDIHEDEHSSFLSRIFNKKSEPTNQNELEQVIHEASENDVIDEYICMHEDIRLLEFLTLEDFITTIAKDYDTYVGLKTDDTSLVDDVSFLGAVTFFVAACPDIMTQEMYATAKERCKQIEKSKGLDLTKIKIKLPW